MMNAMNALGCFVVATFVGGLIGTVPAACVMYAGGGDQAAGATGFVVFIVSGVATFRWVRRLSARSGPNATPG